MSWLWDLDAFATHWYNDRNDRMPTPLRYRSRFPFRDDQYDYQAKVRAELVGEERERVALLVHTVSHCELRIEIRGTTRERQGGPARDYRVVGAQNQQWAAVLCQVGSGEDFGAVRATLLPAQQLPAALTASILGCAPGKQARATFHLDDLKPPTGYTQSANTPRARFERMVVHPTTGGGHAILHLGNYHAPRTTSRAARWYDLADDGRYLEQRNRTHLDIRPATPAEHTAMFTRWIDQATTHLRARADEAYR
ncbi:ESX secretion-associated protein EspG [Nocardia sp. NPDC127579]|uniref:ESX secretion-associated protein EspG n=1 Tax=Nocardia sp. NPDC127579 TaxID=3345402 RepID=UPI00362C7291